MKYLKLFENKYTERNTEETVDVTKLDTIPLSSISIFLNQIKSIH